jgi:Fe(3+) dicitrate transport protein
MDFSNQVIPVSESSGGMGSGYINGGSTRHTGAEISLLAENIDLGAGGYQIGFRMNTTFVSSTFSSDRFMIEKIARNDSKDTVLVNVKGNRTPYAPEWMVNGQIMLETPFGLGMRVSGMYTGSQFTDVLNTRNPYYYIHLAETNPDFRYMQATANGRIGELPSTFLVDLAAVYRHEKSGLELSATVKNLFNERYIASRRPQGIRVGLPRFVMLGLAWGF